ncbi:hypothetical protein D6C92_06192, partial [Aureobasidium pullulans]
MHHFKAEPIAIIGSGCRFPGNASSPSKLWELLHHPRDVSRKIDRFNAAGFFNKDGHYHGASNVSDAYLLEEDTRTFDAQFFNIQAGEAENIDPQQRLLLESAIENLKGSSTAVFVGCMVDDFAGITYHDSEAIPTYGATGISRAILSNRVSYVFDWRGPSMTIDTACSSSLVAIHQAMQVLRDGTSTMAIAAGVNLIFSPNMFIAESNLNMLSPSGKSQMWDADADGYARGEGISAVVLKPLSVAVADGDHIECVIRETALNQDGHTPGITMPSAAAQVRLIRDTYARAGLDLRKHADRCQYFEAHGTGTKAGDGVESRAIHDAFFSSDVDAQKMGPLLVGSVKTIIGHTEGSAGIAGVLRAALAIQNDTIPPNLHFNTLNPEIQPYYGRLRIATEATKWPEIAPRGVRRASVNSFGFGGANAHAILEGYDPGYHGHARHLSRPSNANPLPFVLSATAEKSLKMLVRQYIDYLYLNPDVNVHDLAWTLYHRRSIFPFRVTVPAHDVGDLIPRLEAILDENAPSSESSIVRATSSQKHLLGVFTGQGAQWATMGRDLIKSSQEAESIIDALVVALDQLPAPDRPSWNLKTELFADARNSRITESEISQPLCTAVQILLVNILRTAGVVFESVVGHSSGEIAAAYAAGFLSATDAVRIAYYRGRFAHLAQGSQGQRGAMIAVGTSIDDAVELVSLPAFDGRVSLAACNSSSSVTLSGDFDAVEEIQEVLQDESKFNRLLKVETAYHSHHMNACSEPYAKALQACEIEILQSNGHTKWYSSVHDGQLMESCEQLRAEYWIKNMVNPVFFSAALGAALADPNANSPSLIVEVGPHPALKGPALTTVEEVTGLRVPYTGTLNRGSNDVDSLATAFGRLWSFHGRTGADLQSYDFLFGNQRPLPLQKLPSYPWNHDRIFWHESRESRAHRYRADSAHPLLGVRVHTTGEGEFRWRNYISTRELPWLTGHKIQGQTLMPAAAFLTMAIEAGRFAAGKYESKTIQVIELSDSSIHKALGFNDDRSIETLFYLSEIVLSSDDETQTLSAEFFCEACPSRDTGGFTTMASGKLRVVMGDTSPHVLPATVENDSRMIDVDVNQFYSNLATIGYNYADMFKGITSMKRSAGQAAGTIISTQNTDSQPSTPESYLIHPSALDIAFQTIFAAVSHPGDGALWTLHIPTTVERIIINPSACVSGSGLNTALQFSTCSRISAAGGISGDVDIHAPDNTHRTVQIEGLAVAPVSPATESDDRQMFADTCYVPAIPDAHAVYSAPPEATGEEKRAALAFERLCFYYIRQLTGHMTRQDITTWAQRAVDMTALVKHPIAKPAWLSDTREMFESLVEQVDRNPVYQAGLEAVSTISKALEDDDAVPSTAVEYENLLHRFYETAYGAQRSRDHLTSLVRLIALRHPRIRILEICPADGAVTEQILQTLGESFSSYTISGLSAERFEELQDLSDTIKHRIILKDINLDQDTDDIAVPGGAFDVIISAHGLPTSDRALRMLRYLIKPGGYLAALQATNNDSLSLGLIARFLENSYTLPDDMNRLPDLEGWHGLLEANGFSGVDTATPDDLIPFSVFCSQAVDSAVEVTRQPLSGNTTKIKDILIIGGRKFKVARVVDQTRKLLASTCGNIVNIKSLDLLEDSMVASKPMVLCLTELDDPLFKDLTNLQFANLQNLLSGCRQVLWVVQGASGSNPYANMMKGVFKTLLAEDPGLYVQFLNVEGKIDDCAQPFAEALVRIHLPQTWRSNYECLWTQERELTLRDGQFYISRYLPNRNLDLGYNTLRRKIHTMVNPYQDTVEIVAEGGKLELQRNRVNKRPDGSASAEEFVNVKVTHSIANAILIGNVGRLYLCAGIDQRTSNPVLVFSEHQQSILRVPSSRLVSFKLSSHKIEHLLVCIAANIIASSILESAATRGTVMVHEPEKPLEMMILQKSLASAFTPVFTTSDPRHAGEANWLVVHPHAPSRVIRKIVPKDVSLFVSCSTDNQLANETNVRRCLLPGVRRTSIADFAHSASTKCSIPDDESQTILQNAYQEALSSLEGPDSFEAPIKVPLHELSDGKPVTSTFSTIDWTTKGAVRARVRSAMEEVTFNAHKTYLLIGMTGSMGISTVMYMISRGARSFALASRSPKVDQIWLENTQTEYGAVIRVFSLDITSRESLHKVHQEISKSMLPIGGVANAALVIRDALFVDMDAEKMNESLGPKVTGTLLLDELFQSVDLEFFILYSSLVYITGNQGQTAYCAGNGFLVSQAHGRRSRGLTASVMNLAGISGIGFITRNDHSILDRLDLLGYGVISENDYLYLFAEAVLAGPVDSGRNPEVSGGLRFVDMAKDKHPPVWTGDPTFTHYLLDRSSAGDGESLAASSTSMKSRLLEANSANEIFDIVLSSFAGLLHKQLRLSPEDSVPSDAAIVELGVDSLVAVQIRQWFMDELEISIPVMKILGGATIFDLVEGAVGEISPSLIPQVSQDQSVSPIHEQGSANDVNSTAEGDTESDSRINTSPSSVSNDDFLHVSDDGLSTPMTSSNSEDWSIVPMPNQKKHELLDRPNTQKSRPRIQRKVKMAFAATRFWFLRQYLQDDACFNVVFRVHITGDVDVMRFDEAVKRLGRRHEAFRTCFYVDEETQEPTQGVMADSRLRLERKSVGGEAEAAEETAMLKNHPFDIEHGDVARIAWLTVNPTDHYLVIACHHIAIDGFSNNVLLTELDLLYRDQRLSPVHLQFTDFAVQQRQEVETGRMTKELAFWRSVYPSVPDPLPLFPLSGVQSRQPLTTYGHLEASTTLTKEMASRIRTGVRSVHCTFFHFMLAAFEVFLFRFLETEELVIGIADANRDDLKTLSTVGFLLNLLPLRFQSPESDATFTEVLRRAKDIARAALDNSRLPFDVILNELDVPRSSTYSPLFQVFLDYKQVTAKAPPMLKAKAQGERFNGETGYDLVLDIVDVAGGDVNITLRAQKSLYPDHVEILLHSFMRLVHVFTDDLGTAAGSVQLFGEAERKKAIQLGRGLSMPLTWPETMSLRIEDMVKQYPEDLAVRDAFGPGMTYSVMQETVAKISQRILQEGAAYGTRIAVFQEPSALWICSLLAIWTLGCVYLPLDPKRGLPALSSIVASAQPGLILVSSDTVAESNALADKVPVVNVDRIQEGPRVPPVQNRSKGSGVAVILFTSGSTGKPKGIEVGHAGLVNLLEGYSRSFNVERPAVLQHTTYSFDIALDQILSGLGLGGSLYVASAAERQDPRLLASAIKRMNLSYTKATPSEYVAWIDSGHDLLAQATAWEWALIGGENWNDTLRLAFQNLNLPSLRLQNCYGPTESTINCAKKEIPLDQTITTLSAGTALPNTSIYILNDQLCPVPCG